LAWFAFLVAYILIVFGGYVASSESGMGCGPEWPLCNGAFVPTLHGATFVEYAHRMIGVVLAVLTVILFFKVRRFKTNSQRIRSASYWMIGLLVAQILLGAVVVIVDLPSLIITLHLMVALLFMAIILFLWRATAAWDGAWITASVDSQRMYGLERSGHVKRTLRHIDIICGMLLATIALGGYIKHQQYGLTCGWLSCYDSFLPASGAQWLQFSHRLAAVGTAVYILLFALRSCIRRRNSGLRWRAIFAAVVVLYKHCSGSLPF
jgi:cytochrome c oxidase assembly protein subunit 15